ncbi:MAG TPA: hypothetical protein DCE52_11885 [Rhodobacteraceae bacterium]|jgi:hypothetical protein|nr:hypothetical protein [Paracoccaceae bacterium]
MYIVNDSATLNDRYRSNIIQNLKRSNVEVISLGAFDGCWSFVMVLFAFIFKPKDVITSNLKVNLIFLIFFWSSGLIIVNGLGRLSTNISFRRIIGLFLNINRRKKFFIQNYRDFRYFRRFFRSNIFWSPGSGGRRREFGVQNFHVIVSRSSKLSLQMDSLREAVEQVPRKNGIALVGVDTFTEDLSDLGVSLCGHVAQENIFSFGNSYIQLSGYGEGIPHALIDALVTDIEVHLTKKDFVQYGLNNLGFKFKLTGGKWGICKPFDYKIASKICYKEIANLILSDV